MSKTHSYEQDKKYLKEKLNIKAKKDQTFLSFWAVETSPLEVWSITNFYKKLSLRKHYDILPFLF